MSYQVFDTTLRDGGQREGISYSVVDKLAVARLLDEFGVGFIEGGWPGAMPKDTEFFERAKTELDLKNALLVAFGATRKANVDVTADPQVQALLDAGTPGRLRGREVRPPARRAGASYHRRREPGDGPRHGAASGGQRPGARSVDCEHFFDGFRFDPEYTSSVVRTAFEAGAERVVMCDTNGGMLPSMITAAIQDVVRRTGVNPDPASASTARTTRPARSPTPSPPSRRGVEHFQCTANGYGERPGNADLFAVVSNLQLKLGLKVLPDGCLEKATRVSSALAEIANIAPDTHQAYVGAAAFAHKAGLHASAIKVDPLLYTPRRPVGGGQRHADPGDGDGRPGQHRAEEP